MPSQYISCISEPGHALTVPAALPQDHRLLNWYRCVNLQSFPQQSGFGCKSLVHAREFETSNRNSELRSAGKA